MASASVDGAPYLVPLSFDWDGEALPVPTATDSPDGKLGATRAVRVGWATPAPCPGLAGGERLPEHELMRDGRWLV